MKLITSPGKFEGEPLYVKLLWDTVMDGMGEEFEDEAGRWVSSIVVDADLRTMLPGIELPPDGSEIHLWEDDQGFVHHDVKTESAT